MFKKLTSMMLLISLINVNSASAESLATRLYKDAPAPYDGVLLSDDLAKAIHVQLKNCEKTQLVNTSLTESIELYKKNEVLYKTEVTEVRDENLSLRTALDKSEKNNFWRNALYFGLGVLSTSAIVYATRTR